MFPTATTTAALILSSVTFSFEGTIDKTAPSVTLSFDLTRALLNVDKFHCKHKVETSAESPGHTDHL